MKRKVIILTSLVVLIVLIIIGTCKYHRIATSDEVPLCNLRLRSNSSGFLYLNIMNEGKRFTIVIPNENLSYILNNEKWMPFPYVYIYRIGQILEQNDCLEVSNSLMNKIRERIVDTNLIRQYENKDILNDTSIVRDSTLTYGLEWEKEKIIIYLLLKKKINCYHVHDSGRTKLFLKPPNL